MIVIAVQDSDDDLHLIPISSIVRVTRQADNGLVSIHLVDDEILTTGADIRNFREMFHASGIVNIFDWG